MLEIWKDVKGYEGLYQISNTGKVKSIERVDSTNVKRKERVLKQCLSGRGYPMVGIYKNGKRTPVNIHRLVAEYFVSNFYNKSQVNHIDGIKENNIYTNLEWCSASENIIHAHKNGLTNPVKGEQVGSSKLTRAEAQSVKDLKGKLSQRKIGLMFNICQQEVSKIHTNKCW